MKQLTLYIKEHIKEHTENSSEQLFELFDMLLDDDSAYVTYDDASKLCDYYHIKDIELSRTHNTYVILDKLIMSDKSKGYGSQVMNSLCDWCDKHKMTLCTTPDDSFGSSLSRLKRFYKRFGFIDNKNRNADYNINTAMYRKPKNK